MSSEAKAGLQFRLSPKDRDDFSWPRGVLISGELPPSVGSSAWPKLVCVGDVVTEYCLRSGRRPDVIVVDGRTRRQALGSPAPYPTVVEGSYTKVQVSNPPGGLTPEAIEAVCSALRSGSYLIAVSGEEDMLALAALMCAPPGSLVIYGIPDRGASLVVIDEAISREAQTRLLRLVPEPWREP